MRSLIVFLGLAVSGCVPAAHQSSVDPSEMGRYEIASAAARPASSVAAEASKLAAPAADQPQVELTQRQVIYSASLRLVVVSASEASTAVRKIADSLGGYLQESDNASVTIRVPANQFESAVVQIARLGEVIDRAVKASDVTEQMLDLNIRLDNAKKTRERLLSILEKMEKIEDTLKIEAELLRLTTEIETIEGKLRFMQSQIAMSTIRVELNSTSPKLSGSDPLGVPFPWVGKLGDGLVAGTVESMPRKPRLFAGGPKFTPPAEFLRYYADENLVEAMNADGVRIKVQRHDNYDKGDLAFWKKLARRSLVETRAVAIEREEAIDGNATLILGSRDVAGTQYGYILLLARNERSLYTFEAWGSKAQFEPLRAALETSARSMQR